MWTPFEKWQVARLERLSKTDPGRLEAALNTLWAAQPDLLQRLTIEAYADGEINAAHAAKLLSISVSEVDALTEVLRRNALKQTCVVVCDGSVAKTADGELPIWEIVRVYRRLGSITKLRVAFPSVRSAVIDSALRYARENPAEIERQIEEYESIVDGKERASRAPIL